MQKLKFINYFLALQAPESVEVQPASVAFDQMTLTWSSVSGAEAYRINVNPPQGKFKHCLTSNVVVITVRVPNSKIAVIFVCSTILNNK